MHHTLMGFDPLVAEGADLLNEKYHTLQRPKQPRLNKNFLFFKTAHSICTVLRGPHLGNNSPALPELKL